jgi:anthranilate phosphoribosyltransferase
MRRIDLPGRIVDTCGTGGGRIATLNISTAAALVTAGAGVPVAKHGNRSFTSRSGSADVLEALGVVVDLPPEAAGEVFDLAGIVFLFAPSYHPAMRHVAPVRRELGVATIMNLVGPLANPAGVVRQVVGVAERHQGALMAGALQQLGAVHALVVHAELGLDELSPVGRSEVWEVEGGQVRQWTLDPATLGLATGDLEGTQGGEPGENARAIRELLEEPGRASPALRSAVLLNAAAAIRVSGEVADLPGAVERARAALDSGAAAERLERLRQASQLRTSG